MYLPTPCGALVLRRPLPNTYYAKARTTPCITGLGVLQTSFEVYDFARCSWSPPRRLLTRDACCAASSRLRLRRRGGLRVRRRLGGDFMEWRFLVPVTGVLFAGIGVGLYVLGDGLVRLISGRLFRRRADERAWIAVTAAAAGIACAVAGLGHLDTQRQQDANSRITP